MRRLTALAVTVLTAGAPLFTASAARADDPNAYIVSPSNGDTVSGTAAQVEVVLPADEPCDQSFDMDGVDMGESMEFTAYGPVVGSDETLIYSFDATALSNGTHTLTMTCTPLYDDGTPTYTSSRTISIRNVAPAVAITSPQSGASVVGSGLSVAINAVADLQASQSIVRVDLFVDGTRTVSDRLAPFAVTLDTTKLTNGPHTLTASATDSAGLVGRSTPVQISVTNYHSSFTATPSKDRIIAGESVTIKGSLASIEDGAPLTNAPVGLYVRRADQTGWALVRWTTTDSNGHATAANTSKFSSYYQWRYAGKQGQTAAASWPVLVKAIPVARLTLSSTSVTRGTRVKGTVRLTPNVGGQPLSLRLRRAGGSWHTIARGESTPRVTRLHVVIAHPGTYYVRVVRTANKMGSAASSNQLTLDVR